MSIDRHGRAFAAAAALAWVLGAQTASAEALITGRPLDLHLDRLIIVLVFCIVLAIAAAFLLKRAAAAGNQRGALVTPWLRNLGNSAITVLESRRISVHADVCRLTYAGREYLVVVSQGGATLLKEDAAPSDASP
jgi:hypothetical protein